MRIWHEQLIPKLCQKHLCAMWREGLGVYKIIYEDKKCSYRNHPATKEFENAIQYLWVRLRYVREEMLKRGYHPKEMPPYNYDWRCNVKEWQTLPEQIAILKSKGCKCEV